MAEHQAQRRIKRQVVVAEGSPQIDLFGAGPSRQAPLRRVDKGFRDPDPHDIYLNERRLDEYLVAVKLGWVVGVRTFIHGLDLAAFKARYDLRGRAPYAPTALLGLVLYGTMTGSGSLRGLEELARKDLGAMWMTGGLCPDHATIGRFIQLHEASLTGPFFEQLTEAILAIVGKSSLLAGDGTIVEAAGSRFQIIKKEAADAAAQAAKEKAESAPDDEQAQEASERAAALAAAAQERHDVQRRRESKPNTRVTSTEPEAAVLKGKRGEITPGYVTSAIADENRIIRAAEVTQTDEAKAVPPMMDQAKRVDPDANTMLFDGNYATGQLAQAAIARGIDFLSLPKASTGKAGVFSKQDFQYDETNDVYDCPGGKQLVYRGNGSDGRRNVQYRRYSAGAAVCRACPLRPQCNTSKVRISRVVERYENDGAMEALREVMQHPAARKLLDKRKAIIEPVISDLRGQQGLRRFTRFGLRGARLEFFIHVTAYNLRRLVALAWAAAAGVFAALLGLLVAWVVARPSKWSRPNRRHQFGCDSIHSAQYAVGLSAPAL